jgi:hypothetical protein
MARAALDQAEMAALLQQDSDWNDDRESQSYPWMN